MIRNKLSLLATAIVAALFLVGASYYSTTDTQRSETGNYTVGSTNVPGSDCGVRIVASGGFNTITVPAYASWTYACLTGQVAKFWITDNDTNGKAVSVTGLTSGGFGNVGCGPGNLCPGQTVEYSLVGSSWVVTRGPGPWQLTANVTIYANANSGGTATCGPTGGSTCAAGSDSNDGLSVNSPLLTNNQGIANAQASFQAGFNTTINDAHGNDPHYAVNCGGPFANTATIAISGDSTSPTAVSIKAPNSAGADAIVISDGCTISFSSLAVADNASSNASVLINITKLGQGDFRGVTLQSCAVCDQAEVDGAGAALNWLGPDGASNPNTIVPGAAAAFYIYGGGEINFAGQQTTIPSGGAYSYFAIINGGGAYGLSNTSFTGSGVASVTGPRCLIAGTASFFDAQGNSPNVVFPGNVNCYPENGIAVSWTPTLLGSGTAGSFTPTTQIGSVRVTGQQVNANFTITGTLSGATGNLQIGGLPVAMGGSGSEAASCSIAGASGWTGGAGYTSLSAAVVGGTSTLFLLENGSGVSFRNAPVGDFTGTITLWGSCPYHK